MTKKLLHLIPLGITAILGALLNWLFLPAWTPRSGGFGAFIFGLSLIAFVIDAIITYFSSDEDEWVPLGIYGGIAAVIAVAILISGIAGAKMFNASKYQQLISITEGKEVSDVIPDVTGTEIPVVDMSNAQKLGDRTIGGIKNATWYDVDDEYNVIVYKGKQYRISPLNYSGGVFRYNKAKYFGLPGYVLVDTTTQEAKYVELENPMRFSPSAMFGEDLTRMLRNKYPTAKFNSAFFEIDEEGNPFWVVSIESPKISLYKGNVITSVILVDPCTGECTMHDLEEVPNWVDHVYSVDYIMSLVNYNYKYINGYWNLSKTGVKKTTYEYFENAYAGYNTTVTVNGDIMFYTGVTAVNNAEANLGFILASPRTGKVTYYVCQGAEETSAQAAAEGLVQNLGYKATFPTIINVEEVETYFMVMKDDAGLIQRYAFCQMSNYVNVVQAETMEQALKLYKEKIGLVKKPVVAEKEIEGVIADLYTVQVEGNTNYLFTLEGSADLYKSSIVNNYYQAKMKSGDKVVIKFKDVEGVKTVTSIELL